MLNSQQVLKKWDFSFLPFTSLQFFFCFCLFILGFNLIRPLVLQFYTQDFIFIPLFRILQIEIRDTLHTWSGDSMNIFLILYSRFLRLYSQLSTKNVQKKGILYMCVAHTHGYLYFLSFYIPYSFSLWVMFLKITFLSLVSRMYNFSCPPFIPHCFMPKFDGVTVYNFIQNHCELQTNRDKLQILNFGKNLY